MASPNKADEKMLSAMRGRYTMAMDALGDSRANELDDLKFMAGSSDNNWQWPGDVLSTRGAVQGQTVNARPTLTINKLPQHVRQVTNDQRQNRPEGKVIPANDKADPEMAEILQDMCRHICGISDSDVVYDTACDNQVTYGEGYWRILTKYCSDDSFDQDIYLGRIRNSFGVYLDPTMQDPCGADAEWGFIAEDLLRDVYERDYPDASPVSTLLANGVGDPGMSAWINDKTIRIVEYFYFEHERRTLNLYPGNVTSYQDTPQDAQNRLQYGKPIKSRQVDAKTVKWVKTNGFEVLESQDWAGKYIPIVRVVGNEFEVEGKIYISGLVRNAKDPQRLYNYWASQEAEMLALAPKAPFIGAGGQFEGYETQWKNANIQNYPYLEYNADVSDGSGKPLPPPQRQMPPMAQTGLIQAKMGAGDDIKSTTGQYDSSIGASSNERTGKAILARERQGDTGTYHYVDNLARAVRYSTRQLVDLIPKIYDTQRVARIVGQDGVVSMAKINPQQPMAVNTIRDQQTGMVIEKIYNPGVGEYDVVITTGPSYLTKRQEAMESMSQILQGAPQLWAVAGDLFIKNMDWPGAQEMAERFRATMDPKVLAADNSDKSPELQAAEMQMQNMAKELDSMHTLLKNVQNSEEHMKNMLDQMKVQVSAYDAETKRIAALTPTGAFTPEQLHDMIMGTLHAAIASGDILSGVQQSGMISQQPPPDVPPAMPQQPPGPPMQPPPGA